MSKNRGKTPYLHDSSYTNKKAPQTFCGAKKGLNLYFTMKTGVSRHQVQTPYHSITLQGNL